MGRAAVLVDDHDFRLYRIGNEAELVGVVMQAGFFFRRGGFVPIFDARMQFDRAYPGDAFFVFRHVADRLVAIRDDVKASARGEEQKREHVAARNGRDESFFRVDIRWIGMRNGHDGRARGGGHGQAPVERPGVFTRVFPVDEVASGKTPIDGGFVLGHESLRYLGTFQMSFVPELAQ